MKAFFKTFAVFAASSGLATAALPQFKGEEALPALGLAIPSMKGGKQTPVRPVEVVRYTRYVGDRVEVEDRAAMDELWWNAQTAATWEDEDANILILGRVMVKPSAALAGTEVTQDVFDRYMNDPGVRLGPSASVDELFSWMEEFTGTSRAGSPNRLSVNSSRFAALWHFPMDDPLVRAFAFRIDRSRAGLANAPAGWFALVFFLSEQPSGQAFDRTLRDSFLGGVKALSLSDPSRRNSAKNRQRPSSGAEASSVREDAARLRARASVEMLDSWWFMDSENFILLSDDPGATRNADSILAELEAMKPLYEALVPPFPQVVDQTSVVRLFRMRDDYIDYLDGSTILNPAATSGIFDGARRELVLRPQEKNSVLDRSAILRHEGFHQHVFSAWGGIPTSAWFNEGTAVLFESYHRGANGWSAPEHVVYAPMLEKIARARDADWPGLVNWLLRADYAGFYSAAPGGDAHISYALSYGLMYFLYRGAPYIRGNPYGQVLDTYAAELARTHDPARATFAAFKMGEKGEKTAFVEKLASDLQAFWKNNSARRDARNAPISGANSR